MSRSSAARQTSTRPQALKWCTFIPRANARCGNGADREYSIADIRGGPGGLRAGSGEGQKIKKSGEDLTLCLTETVDILAEVGKRKDGIILVGFAAETENLESFAKAKLQRKHLDLIVVNDVSPESDVFGSDTNQVTLISKTGEKIEWPRNVQARSGKSDTGLREEPLFIGLVGL